jgi:hypothetical protein
VRDSAAPENVRLQTGRHRRRLQLRNAKFIAARRNKKNNTLSHTLIDKLYRSPSAVVRLARQIDEEQFDE